MMAFSDQARDILSLLGGSDCARIVGGAVRNHILGLPLSDLDIATKHTPDKIISIAESAGIKAIPTGIDHGTVTLVYQDTHFEITTLRRDVETDGRHAKVMFSQNWEDDALRRDFTMNALYADEHGVIYDPLGCGIEDARQRRVVFVGKASQRIKEDALRILRFFRFNAQYGQGPFDREGIKACRTHADLLQSLSAERITQEFLKLIVADFAAPVMRIMDEIGVLNYITGDLPYDLNRFEAVHAQQKKWQQQDASALLYGLIGRDARECGGLLLSRKEINYIKTLRECVQSDLLPKNLKASLYRYGRRATMQACFAASRIVNPDDVDVIQNWDIPKFPITGSDLIAEGFETGAALGAELKRREQDWIDNGFSLKED